MTTKQEQKAEGKKHPGGRPTDYKPEFVEDAERLCREEGYTDKNLATHFKVHVATIYVWKRRYPEFHESLKKGKDNFDTNVVEQALLKRALGYFFDEVTKEPVIVERGIIHEGVLAKDEPLDEAIEKSLVVVKIVTKKILGDVTAQIFWLKNRNPARWSDKKEIDHRIEGITKTLTNEEALAKMHEIQNTGDGIDWRSIEGSDRVLKIGQKDDSGRDEMSEVET